MVATESLEAGKIMAVAQISNRYRVLLQIVEAGKTMAVVQILTNSRNRLELVLTFFYLKPLMALCVEKRLLIYPNENYLFQLFCQ